MGGVDQVPAAFSLTKLRRIHSPQTAPATDYRVTVYRVTDYRVTNYRVTDYRSPRAILRLIALEGLVASLLGRIFADKIDPRTSPASSSVLRRPTSDLEDDFSTFAYDWNQILLFRITTRFH